MRVQGCMCVDFLIIYPFYPSIVQHGIYEFTFLKLRDIVNIGHKIEKNWCIRWCTTK